ncbi:MAG: hypothetical protein H6719_38555, partial [Sandaracinaceae bacterium]|nr:hypothetical protein [Sandaracinaceae bacterium]
VRGACLGRFCVEYPDDALCDTGRCDRSGGCLADAQDGGVDAGTDAGTDGGFDAGVDAGPPCVSLTGITTNISFSPLSASSPTWAAVNGACTATGEMPYYTDYTYCNRQSAPYGFSLEIVMHPGLPNIPNPTIWGFPGPSVSDASACDFAVTGIGSRTPYQLLMPGEYYTLRIGGTRAGDTGAVAAQKTP